jgi:uncharacterized protein YqhQ
MRWLATIIFSRKGNELMREDQIIVGGQAVIEGVMMRAPHSYAVAVRRPDGEIVAKSERLPVLAEKYPLLKLPVLRGSAVLIQSMVLGIKALNFSANVVFHEAEKERTAEEPEFQPAGLRPGISSSVAVATKVKPASEVKTTAAAGAIGSIILLSFSTFCFS